MSTDRKALAFSVLETAQLLSMSVEGVYLAIRRRQILAIRIGRRILVPRLALERLLEKVSAD
jgi:excisionase family DNA binding protein